jgi:ATP-dependent protease HslVU (ClpYQ) peptidase subunit
MAPSKTTRKKRFASILKGMGNFMTVVSFLSLVGGAAVYLGDVKSKLGSIDDIKSDNKKFRTTMIALLDEYKKSSETKDAAMEQSLVEKIKLITSLQGSNDKLQRQIDAILSLNRTTTYAVTAVNSDVARMDSAVAIMGMDDYKLDSASCAIERMRDSLRNLVNNGMDTHRTILPDYNPSMFTTDTIPQKVGVLKKLFRYIFGR